MPDFTETNKKTESDIVENEKEGQQTTTHKSVNWLRIGILAGIVPAVLFAVTLGEYFFGIGGTFCLGALVTPFTFIGAYMGKRSNKTAWIGAVLGTLLGVGLPTALIFMGLFAQ